MVWYAHVVCTRGIEAVARAVWSDTVLCNALHFVRYYWGFGCWICQTFTGHIEVTGVLSMVGILTWMVCEYVRTFTSPLLIAHMPPHSSTARCPVCCLCNQRIERCPWHMHGSFDCFRLIDPCTWHLLGPSPVSQPSTA
jgi:hypothetical protein